MAYLFVGSAALGVSIALGPWDEYCADNLTNLGCPSQVESWIWTYGPFGLTILVAAICEVLVRRAWRSQRSAEPDTWAG